MKKTKIRVVAKSNIGAAGELHQQPSSAGAAMTTRFGAPLSDNQNSLRAGPRGPTLLEDFILRDKLAHFDRERIPERVVHARATGAHGWFELTKSLSKYTSANVLRETGVKVPVFARLSTVLGGRGSADTPRDVRGFAVKFYTKEGNWDLVGNNIPVFFIQDAMKFPDLVHAAKPEPDRGYPEGAGAHDTFWDFLSLSPESMHMAMWIMSDRTLPRSLRMMEGFGVHTYRLIDAKGKSTFVKFHWRPMLGLQSHLWDEAVKVSGADKDYHRRDMWESIEAGKFPEWELHVQLFTEKDAAKFPFDHLDPTKLIPEELVPLLKIGRMVLDRNPDNFFAETEQVAFSPANVPRGIGFSNDPLLQGRLFSYGDTHLHRLGTSNVQNIPINAPKCPVAHYQRDGFFQNDTPKGRVAYEPNSLDVGGPRASADGYRSNEEIFDDVAKGTIRAESFADHYSQARMFYRSQTEIEQAHIASAFVFELSKVETLAIRERMVARLRNVDEDLARRVANGLNMSRLPAKAPASGALQDLGVSPALGLVAKTKPTLTGRCLGVLYADGSSEKAIRGLVRAAKSEGATVKLIAPKIGGATLDSGEVLQADGHLAGSPSVLFDAVAVILSADAAAVLSREGAAIEFLRDAFAHLKAIALDEGGEQLLRAAALEKDPFVVSSRNVQGFLKKACTRHWEREPTVRTLA
jgi:catalase